MKPYPRNNINYKPINPEYVQNNTLYQDSRYVINQIIDNLPRKAFELKLTNSISQNETFNGYYYTTKKNDNLYNIAKEYYNDEKYYWIIAKANGLKDSALSIIPQGIVLIIPLYSELQNDGGYFSMSR